MTDMSLAALNKPQYTRTFLPAFNINLKYVSGVPCAPLGVVVLRARQGFLFVPNSQTSGHHHSSRNGVYFAQYSLALGF